MVARFKICFKQIIIDRYKNMKTFCNTFNLQLSTVHAGLNENKAGNLMTLLDIADKLNYIIIAVPKEVEKQKLYDLGKGTFEIKVEKTIFDGKDQLYLKLN